MQDILCLDHHTENEEKGECLCVINDVNWL
jgi:hypothetical protein